MYTSLSHPLFFCSQGVCVRVCVRVHFALSPSLSLCFGHTCTHKCTCRERQTAYFVNVYDQAVNNCISDSNVHMSACHPCNWSHDIVGLFKWNVDTHTDWHLTVPVSGRDRIWQNLQNRHSQDRAVTFDAETTAVILPVSPPILIRVKGRRKQARSFTFFFGRTQARQVEAGLFCFTNRSLKSATLA